MEAGKFMDFCKVANNLFDKICTEFDTIWQKRKRVLSSKLLVLFILKLVLSKNKQGYGSNLIQFWESCAEKGIMLPQINSVAASSLCEARQKLPEEIFKKLNTELLSHWHSYQDSPTWNGHRIFAVDGSKINAPRELLSYGYKLETPLQHYPRGLMSCMYNLLEQTVYDFDFVAHCDERLCAIEHLNHLTTNDIVIFDRGYFSYYLLYKIIELNLHVVFRMPRGTVSNQVAAFWESDNCDEIIEYIPSKEVKYSLKKRGIDIELKPLRIRLIKHKIGDETYVYATTLIGKTYPIECFADLYHERWGIEELYKISKSFIEVDDFHAKTERGVKHELYGHLLIINIARIFEFNAKNMLPSIIQNTNETVTDENSNTINYEVENQIVNSIKINFKNCILVVGRYLENLILAPVTCINSWLDMATNAIAKLRQKVRPNRSYQRRSHKPRAKWYSGGKVVFNTKIAV